MHRFTLCLKFVLAREGGFVNNPNDRGGATNQGVTQKVYSTWLADRNQVGKSVRMISADEIAAIYKENYWTPSNAGNCPSPVDLCVFDCAVNSGVGRSVRMLQEAAGVDADGVFGPRTLAAVQAVPAAALVAKLCGLRRAFYQTIVRHNQSQAVFLNGWLARIDALEKECLHA